MNNIAAFQDFKRRNIKKFIKEDLQIKKEFFFISYDDLLLGNFNNLDKFYKTFFEYAGSKIKERQDYFFLEREIKGDLPLIILSNLEILQNKGSEYKQYKTVIEEFEKHFKSVFGKTYKKRSLSKLNKKIKEKIEEEFFDISLLNHIWPLKTVSNDKVITDILINAEFNYLREKVISYKSELLYEKKEEIKSLSASWIALIYQKLGYLKKAMHYYNYAKKDNKKRLVNINYSGLSDIEHLFISNYYNMIVKGP